MLDVMSGGRIVSGFPVGTPMDTTFCYGLNPATLRERYREGVDLILRAWQSREPFAFNGKYSQLRYVNVWPRPIQTPHPPVWVPGESSVETWDWCVKNDFLYAYLSYFGWQLARKVMDGYWETVERHGRDRNPHRAGFLQFVAVADSDAEAEKLYSDAALYFYNRCLHVYPGFVNPPGYRTIPTIRKGILSQVSKSLSGGTGELTWKDIVDRGYIVAGSPDRVVEQITEMSEEMNVGHVMVLCHFGNLSKETTLYNTQRFAEEVIPRLRSRYDEWEDHWWPKDDLLVPAEPAPIPTSVSAA